MSDIALTLLDRLRQNGVDDDDARRIAQSLDQSVENVLREAIAHADRHRAETDEKIGAAAAQVKANAERIKAHEESAKAREEQLRTEFVPAAKYYERDKTLVTREEFHAEFAKVRAEIAEHRKENRADIAELRKENHAQIAELRKDIRAFYRILVIAVVGGAGAAIGGYAGLIALIVKLYFGS